uniref:Valine--tRNA ligase n=1 Tax=candidate division WOR-3 bacterium TaxID=2052148 RepID=A0A7C3N5F2_UNCW3
MDKVYDFKRCEEKWNSIYNERKPFKVKIDHSKKPYTIVIPPPNVTDILHLGHAFNNTIQDILIRYHRNKGYNALWVPGTDHAGIATQVVVERNLKKEGKKKDDLGREHFEKEVWNWAEEHKNIILNQLKALGATCDWDRTKFTLDEDMSRTVAFVFKKLYEKGYIYKGNYIVNWCPRCHTALSDEEVDYNPKKGKLYYIRYPFKKRDGYIVVATTRPETMLGDTAVAVNPSDETKNKLIGESVIVPLINREIKIIGDDFVDINFGTGFVKVTPAHDPNDFVMGEKHSLEKIIVLDTKGFINENGGKYKGLDRYKAREEILKDLESLNLLEKIEDYENSVGECYRCKTVVEPYLSEQWFVKMDELAKPALKASIEKELRFFPQRWQGVYNHWLSNIKPWCISRQLWWGHRIPVYYCDSCKKEVVSVDKIEVCPECGGKVHQDENVLDTWFSSWLWPFATLGWIDGKEDFKYFYPTKVIVSASEILFFWIARMIMAGIEFTGELPFKDIYIHGTIRDSRGIKMSKSLGNGIDPLIIINKFGADALRFTLIFLSGQGTDPKISEKSFELGRNFANKIWNATRLILGQNENEIVIEKEEKDDFDRWILHLLSKFEKDFQNSVENYRLSEGAEELYNFFWKDFCDWYLEIMKVKEKGNGNSLFVLKRFLRNLNPYMPYISEEINSLLGSEKMIHEEEYKSFEYFDERSFENVEMFKSLVVSIRNIVSETGVKNIFVRYDGKDFEFLNRNIELIKKLSKVNTVEFKKDIPQSVVAKPFEEGIVYINSKDIEDIQSFIKKLEKEKEELEKEIDKNRKLLENENFIKKAENEVVEETKRKIEEFLLKLDRVREILKGIR